MPLDVQPLSPARRAGGLLLLLALLISSLGVADLLVMRTNANRQKITVQFPPPPGVAALPVNTLANFDPDTPPASAEISSNGFQREFIAYDIDVKGEGKTAWSNYLNALLVLSTGESLDFTTPPMLATLGGRQAMERMLATQAPDEWFVMLRLTVVDEERLVAFCYSGEGPITESDNKFFNDYCANRIKIQIKRPNP